MAIKRLKRDGDVEVGEDGIVRLTSKGRETAYRTAMLSSKKSPNVENLIKMYESDGITPDFLLENGVIENIPPDFYLKLAELHKIGRAHV